MLTAAIAIHKGGVGKTTSTVTLAAFAAAAGLRVLLVDADAQANATFWLLGEQRTIELEQDLTDAIVDHAPATEVIVETRLERLDVLPATLRVAELDLRLMADPGRRDQRLRRALDGSRERYDLILIDCPPSLSLMTVNALAAADVLLSPCQLTNFSLLGLQRFLEWVEQFRVDGIHSARHLGIIPTFYDPRTVASREGLLALHNSGHRLFPPVPRRTAVEVLVSNQQWVGEVPEGADVAQPYKAVADVLIDEVRRSQ